jgi:apolipoprotein N-acyltransferase
VEATGHIRRANLGLRLGATLLSAALYVAAFPRPGWWPLAWIALVPLLHAARGSGVAGAFGLGLLWTEVWALVLYDALPGGIAEYFGRSLAFGFMLAIGVYTLAGGVFYGAALAVCRLLVTGGGIAQPLLVAACWCAFELARTRLLGPGVALGVPLGLVGQTQVPNAPLLQLASVVGVCGVGFAVVAVNAGLVQWWRERTPAALAVAILLAGAAELYGWLELRTAPADSARAPLAVLAVQANRALGSSWEPGDYGRNLDAYLRLTQQGAQASRPELVLWPESALTFPLVEEVAYRDLIARVLGALEADLIAGAPRLGDGATPPVYDSVFALSRAGEVVAHYDKQYLVPLAETDPLGWQPLARSFGPYRYWERGLAHQPLAVGATRVGVLVCNEALFPQLAAERVRDGAELLFLPANDGWLGGGWLGSPRWGALMLDLAVLRAVEQRRFAVRVAASGPSAVVDPWGGIRARADEGVAAAISAVVEPRTAPSAYARLGDAFGIACGVAVALALAARAGSRRRRARLRAA